MSKTKLLILTRLPDVMSAACGSYKGRTYSKPGVEVEIDADLIPGDEDGQKTIERRKRELISLGGATKAEKDAYLKYKHYDPKWMKLKTASSDPAADTSDESAADGETQDGSDETDSEASADPAADTTAEPKTKKKRGKRKVTPN